MTKKIPLMLDGSVIEAEYSYENPDVKITGIYIAGVRVEQDNLIDAVLEERGIDDLEREIRDIEWGGDEKIKENESFLIDNHWPETWGM